MPIQEMIAIRNSGDRKAKLALLMAMHCAPLMKGLAVANVLTVHISEVSELCRLLGKMKIFCCILYTRGERVILYLYREKNLVAYLQREESASFLGECGYPDKGLEKMLKLLAEKMALYEEGKGEFPHELGVFLGYPMQDVKGFIENDGKNFICMGYWKVYHNEAEAKRCFRSFDEARKLALQEVISGRYVS